MNSSLSNNASNIFDGWAPQPDGRGTLDILWGCLFTNFLCSWAVLCLNVSAPGESYLTTMKRKFLWMLCIIIGPEVTLALALGQYCSAKRSVADFKRLDKPEWTLEHGFFADMGGIMISAPTWCSTEVFEVEQIAFPINAKQLHYLVERRYLDFPDIPKDTIQDKSKNDDFARFLISAQALWFVMQCFSRLIQHLPITTLELTTTSVVLSSLPIFWCWSKKPCDVEQPIHITMTTAISTILIRAGRSASRPYDRTPLDFICTDDWNFDLYCSVGMELAASMFKVKSIRPLNRLTTADFPRPERWAKIVLVIFELAFSAIHLAAWNFHFPSRIEKLFWRCASCTLLGCYVWYWAGDALITHIRSRAKAWALEVQVDGDISDVPDQVVFCCHSMKQFAPLEMKRAPSKKWKTSARARFHTIPFTVGSPWSLPTGCALIIAVRLYIVVEVFVGLRSVQKGIYDDIEWSKFLPHL